MRGNNEIIEQRPVIGAQYHTDARRIVRFFLMAGLRAYKG